MKKRVLALLLTLIMVMSLIPTTALAAMNTGHQVSVRYKVLILSDEYSHGYNYGPEKKTTFTCRYNVAHSNTAYANHKIAISDIKTAQSDFPGYEFAGWTKTAKKNPQIFSFDLEDSTACNKDGTIYLVVKKAAPAEYQLTVNTNPVGGATTGSGTYAAGTKVNVTASAPTATDADHIYVFQNWTGATGSEKSSLVTMPATAATATANYKVANDFNHNNKDDATEDHFTVTYTDGVADEVVFEDDVHADVLTGMPTPAFTGGTPTRTGWTFKGWQPAVAATVTDTVTYEATWDKSDPILDDYETLSSILGTNVVKFVCKNGVEGHEAVTYGLLKDAYKVTKIDESTAYVDLWIAFYPPVMYPDGIHEYPSNSRYITLQKNADGQWTVASSKLPVVVEGVCEVKPVTYTVTFNANGGWIGTSNTQSVVVENGKNVPAASVPTPVWADESHEFMRWFYYDDNNAPHTFDKSTVVNGDMDVYAEWKTVEQPPVPEVDLDDYETLSSILGTNVVKFVCKNGVEGHEAVTYGLLKDAYKVTKIDESTAYVDLWIAFYPPVMYPDGIHEYPSNSRYITLQKNADGQWTVASSKLPVVVEGVCEVKPVTYTVTFNANGGWIGTSNTQSVVVENGKNVPAASVPTPVWADESHEFMRWFYYDDNNARHTFDESTVVNGNMDVYAEWKTVEQPPVPEVDLDDYETLSSILGTNVVKFVCKNGVEGHEAVTYGLLKDAYKVTKIDESTAYVDLWIAFYPPVMYPDGIHEYPSNSRYITLQKNADGQWTVASSKLPVVVEGVCEVKPVTYTVTFNANGGWIGTSNTQSVVVENGKNVPAASVPTPVWADESHEFMRWFYYDDNNAPHTFDKSTVVNGDMDVYAEWKTVEQPPVPEVDLDDYETLSSILGTNVVKFVCKNGVEGHEAVTYGLLKDAYKVTKIDESTAYVDLWIAFYPPVMYPDGIHEYPSNSRYITLQKNADGQWTVASSKLPVVVEGVCEVKPVTYTVTFNANGGWIGTSNTQSVVVENGKNVPAASVPTPVWADESHEFMRWFYYDDNNARHTFDESTVVNGNMDVYAEWKTVEQPPVPEVDLDDYETLSSILGTNVVKFVCKNGVEGHEAVTYGLLKDAYKVTKIDESTAYVDLWIAFYPPVMYPDGIHEYPSNSRYITLQKNADGQWTVVSPRLPVVVEGVCEVKPENYTVTFNNGTTEHATVEVAVGSSVADKMPENPVRDGYIFAGWNTEADGSGTAFVATTSVSADTTVWAQWTKSEAPVEPDKETFRVDFDSKGGTPVGSKIVIDGEKVPEPADPTRTDYKFAGWYLNGAKYDFSTPVTGNLTLVAAWTYVGGSSSGGSGSSHSSSSGTSYTLKYVTNGGKLAKGVKTTESKSKPWEKDFWDLAFPVREGYRFNGWFLDESLKEKYRVEDDVDVDKKGTTTLYADWVKFEGFEDVAEDFWAYDAIMWAGMNGYTNGESEDSFRIEDTFAPYGVVTREQMWMILARLSGETPADMAEAREWAMETEVSDGSNPTNFVTRQQMVAILYRYADLMGYDVSARADLTTFSDHVLLADYAVEPMGWSVANSIVGGTLAGTLDPFGNATRAQFITIIMRFCSTFEG